MTRSVKSIGSQSWLSIAIIQTETLLCVKWGRNMFPTPAPDHVITFWSWFATALLLFTVVRFTPLSGLFKRKDAAAKEAKIHDKTN